MAVQDDDRELIVPRNPVAPDHDRFMRRAKGLNARRADSTLAYRKIHPVPRNGHRPSTRQSSSDGSVLSLPRSPRRDPKSVGESSSCDSVAEDVRSRTDSVKSSLVCVPILGRRSQSEASNEKRRSKGFLRRLFSSSRSASSIGSKLESVEDGHSDDTSSTEEAQDHDVEQHVEEAAADVLPLGVQDGQPVDEGGAGPVEADNIQHLDAHAVAQDDDLVEEATVPPQTEVKDGFSMGNVMEELLHCGFYFGCFGGQESMDLLAHMPDGSFIVRNSDDSRSLFAVTYRTMGETGSTRIQYRQGKFSLNFLDPRLPSSPSVVGLIEQCVRQSRNDPVCMVLINGVQHFVYLRHPLYVRNHSLKQLARKRLHLQYARQELEKFPIPPIQRTYLVACPARPEVAQVQELIRRRFEPQTPSPTREEV